MDENCDSKSQNQYFGQLEMALQESMILYNNEDVGPNSQNQYFSQLKIALQESIISYNNNEVEYLLDIALQESTVAHNNDKKNNINKILENESLYINENLFRQAYLKLNDYQKDIFLDCIDKSSGGLSLPLGSGKTIISLVLSLYFTRNNNSLILVVASKSLIANWELEIKKFFGNNLKYEVVHQTILKNNINLWKIEPDTNLVLTTIDVLSKFYKEHNVDKKFVVRNYMVNNAMYINEYKKPDVPFLNHVIGGGIFFTKKWGCLIVDEVQKYTNIDTLWCQSLGSLCSDHRWLLSGTMFDEPKINRILGYHIILNAEGKPRDLPKTKELIYDAKRFKGLNETLISRSNNDAFIPPKVNEQIITHKLSYEEEKIYMTMKKILNEVTRRAKIAKLFNTLEGEDEFKKFNSYKLVMIMYLRQALICPLIPITSIAINSCDMKNKSELSEIIMNEINKMGISEWLNKEESVKSSRINETIKCTDKHLNERVIIFSCFKSYLNILHYYVIKPNRPIFMMNASMSSKKRGELLKNFEKSKNGILLITYQLGAEGLNLQFASTVLLIDFWWNASKTQQAIGRIFRYGQIADEINIYFFTANTGIEQMLFQKQKAKLSVLNELQTGIIKTKIPKMSVDNIIKMIDIADNKRDLKKIKYY
jgi:SNF2 family DNA or RNA helicase